MKNQHYRFIPAWGEKIYPLLALIGLETALIKAESEMRYGIAVDKDTLRSLHLSTANMIYQYDSTYKATCKEHDILCSIEALGVKLKLPVWVGGAGYVPFYPRLRR